VDAREIGFFREVVKVNILGALEDELLDVTAQVVEQKLTLLSSDKKGGILETASFGNIFFGETKTITAILINTGPNPLNYAMSYDDVEDENGGGGAGKNSHSDDPQSGEDAAYAKSLVISPLDGTLKGFSQQLVTITFNPSLIVPEKGFTKQHVIDNKAAKKIERKVGGFCCVFCKVCL
jgi:hypothetical protein